MGRFGFSLMVVLLLAVGVQSAYTANTSITNQVPTSLDQQATPVPQLTPTITTDAPPPARPLGYTTIMALSCLFMLSVVTLAGSVAMKRRFDAISPDRS
ncbi:MAG: hypothetical protein AB4911_05800 [Oscillochloridaceae bacterium umkhey_bin13]